MTPKQRLIAKIGAGAVAAVVPLVVFFEGEIRHGYKDPVGIVTACVGHTETAKIGKTYTKLECEYLLYHDLLKHTDALDCIKVPLNENQKAALLSFSFNVGNDAFCKSTLVKRANKGDLMAACAQLSRWTHAGGKELPGLVKRRAAERALCEKGIA